MNMDLPNQEDLASLRILDEIEREPSVTQRELSRRVGVSLGLTNLLLQRMAQKAWVKVRTVPGRRLLYAITPRGFTEKVRKTTDFIRLSFRYYGRLRAELAERIRTTLRGHARVAIYGSGDLAQIVRDAAHESGSRYLGSWKPGMRGTKPNCVVLLEPVDRSHKRTMDRCGMLIIELY